MIHICCLEEMPAHVERLRPSHLVSLVNPEEMPETPALILAERHLRLAMHDIVQPWPGCIPPGPEHVGPLLAFLERWAHDEAPLLIHCYAGISRSTAAALTALVVKAGPGREAEAAATLRAAAPHAQPNRRLIALADQALEAQGRLLAARDAMGYAPAGLRGPLVSIPLLPLT